MTTTKRNHQLLKETLEAVLSDFAFTVVDCNPLFAMRPSVYDEAPGRVEVTLHEEYLDISAKGQIYCRMVPEKLSIEEKSLFFMVVNHDDRDGKFTRTINVREYDDERRLLWLRLQKAFLSCYPRIATGEEAIADYTPRPGVTVRAGRLLVQAGRKLLSFARGAKAPTPREGHSIYEQGGRWGFNISTAFKDQEKGIFDHTGHWTPKPVKGDVMHVSMKSGRIAVSVFTKVKATPQVHDMFFAESVFIGYLDELKKSANAA